MKGILSHVIKRKETSPQHMNEPILIDVFLDHSIYDKFKSYVLQNNLEESSALVNVLENGMANYWLEEFKELKQRYQLMQRISRKYKEDRRVFEALTLQNEQLRKLLDEIQQENSITSNERH